MHILEFADKKIPLRRKKILIWKSNLNLKIVDRRLDEKMQPVVLEKVNSNTKKHLTWTKIWAIQATQILEKKDQRGGNAILSNRRKSKKLIQSLTKKILAVAALRGTKFEYRDQSDQYSSLAYFCLSSVGSKKLKALFGTEVNLSLKKCRLVFCWSKRSHRFWITKKFWFTRKSEKHCTGWPLRSSMFPM